jgi:hypothetical protein
MVIDIFWDPLGPGWFGSRGNQLYEVRYQTKSGKNITVTCKTGLFSGVYWSGNSIPS